MKQLKSLFTLLLVFTVIFTACNGEKKDEAKTEAETKTFNELGLDINLDEIESACDCLDAAIIISERMMEVYASVDNPFELTDEHFKQLEAIEELGAQFDVVCQEYEDEDFSVFEKCDSYQRFLELTGEFDAIYE